METGKVAGIIDGFDHFGACLGGLFTGSFLVPLFGTEGSCILNRGLKPPELHLSPLLIGPYEGLKNLDPLDLPILQDNGRTVSAPRREIFGRRRTRKRANTRRRQVKENP